jgi:hypothetical protein
MPNATTINIPENININIGIPGQKGTNGLKGDKGDPFRYEDFTPDQLQALKGEKGDKGEALTFEDLTPDQVALLKGEKGEKGDTPTIPNTVRFLKENFIYLPSEDLDTVLLTALKEINNTSSFVTSYEAVNAISPFTVDPFNDGDENITVHGYNHCKVQIANEAPVEILNNKAIVPIPKTSGDFINVKYINLLGEVVESKTIEKIKEDDTPAVVYQDATSPSMKLSVKGTKAVLDFMPSGRNKLRDYTLSPLQDKVKRLIIDLANSNGISDYVTLPFVPEKIEILNYKANNLNLSFQGDYHGTTKVVTEKSIPGYTLNNNGEYEVYSLNGKTFLFSDSGIYVGDAL